MIGQFPPIPAFLLNAPREPLGAEAPAPAKAKRPKPAELAALLRLAQDALRRLGDTATADKIGTAIAA